MKRFLYNWWWAITLWAILIACFLLAGCATPAPMTNGIANLETVDENMNLLRGGQPTQAGFDWLKKHGIKTIIKLNPEDPPDESDNYAEQIGLKVLRFPIDTDAQLFGPCDNAAKAADAIRYNTFVHCLHGQDRTGLTIAIWRVRYDGWSKIDAEAEMISHGFHKGLMGLWSFWQHHVP